MRSSRSSLVRQTTSSRQSPNKSALTAGVALVPLFAVQSAASSKGVSLLSDQFHLAMRFRSSNSRNRSPSHQTPKLQELGGRDEIFSPFALNRPEIGRAS